jgi:hypothetical protein
MLTRQRKSIVGGSIFLCLLLCAAAGLGLVAYQKATSCYRDIPPLRSIDVTIDGRLDSVQQSQQLIQQLEKFADQNKFKYEVNYYTPRGDNFSVWIRRKDVEVLATSPVDNKGFMIFFYNNDCIHPTVASDIGGLVSDLESYINQIPSAVISEDKQ